MTKDVGVGTAKGTMESDSPLRRRYLKALDEARLNLEKAKFAYDEAEAKLKAYDLVAPDLLGENPESSARPLVEPEVESIALGMRGTFSYRDVVRVAFRERGQFVDAVSVRTMLNRLAAKDGSSLEVVKRGEGKRASIFKVKRAPSESPATVGQPEPSRPSAEGANPPCALLSHKEEPM